MGQTLLAQASGIRHPKQASHPRRMGTNGTPPSARRMWHERAAHACDFAQRYAEPQQLTPLPCGGPARLDPSLEPRRSAVLISGFATGPPAGVGGGLGPFLAA
ncbi:MAG: hypothetical protein ACXVBB_14980 [Isosphaeraceae bacterium]